MLRRMGIAGRGGFLASLAGLMLAGCPPAASKDNAWQLVLDQVDGNGQVSVDTARAAFVLAFGPLPGVPDPPGVRAVIGSATFATSAVDAHYGELTPDQQVAVEK